MLTIKEIEDKVKEVYIIRDEGVIRVVLATVIGNRINLNAKPIWLLLCAGSSSGKTSVLQLLDKCGEWLVPIDTMTTNTFASALERSEEVSLLWKANNGILVFKDFTTITSMNEDGLREVMGQLRAIYDGSFNKKTGNNNDVDWHGKLGVIAGGTIATQRKMRQFSEQGERFINYILKVADPKDIARKAISNQKNLKEKEEELALTVAQFVNEKLDGVKKDDMVIPEEIIEKMIVISDFVTMARSPVTMNKKDPTIVDFVGDREYPARVAMMLTNLSMALMIVADEDTLGEVNAKIIYKTALDSIPVERRLVLSLLAKYREATSKGLATALHYQTSTVRAWCNQLDALKMIRREKIGTTDMWVMEKEYKKILAEFENIYEEDVMLGSEFDDDNDTVPNAYTSEADFNDKVPDILDEIFDSNDDKKELEKVKLELQDSF